MMLDSTPRKNPLKLRSIVLLGFGVGLTLVGGLVLGARYAGEISQFTTSIVGRFQPDDGSLLSPFISFETKELPLKQYALSQLPSRQYVESPINLVSEISPADESEKFASYVFSYTTLGKKMTGQLNLPTEPNGKVIVMLRGYVPPEIYEHGVGTRNAAARFANEGYITIAPDFFGYGESEPEFEDPWEARFTKPIEVAELLKSLEQYGVPTTITETAIADGADSNDSAQQRVSDNSLANTIPIQLDDLALWAHSNGGQIALSTLMALGEPIPTTLWAPVTAPFPYSIGFFGDELPDEGKEQRKWIALFEEDYDAFDFSLSQHLGLLPGGENGPIQIHHGTGDDAALYAWSDEFVNKLAVENDRRERVQEEFTELAATQGARVAEEKFGVLKPELVESIEFELFTYPGADHNLQPGWETVVDRDLEFFDSEIL